MSSSTTWPWWRAGPGGGQAVDPGGPSGWWPGKRVTWSKGRMTTRSTDHFSLVLELKMPRKENETK